VQEIEGIDRELASLTLESSFEQSKKSGAPSGPREAQLGIQDRGMGRDGAQRVCQAH
jgi:hypothetical protein